MLQQNAKSLTSGMTLKRLNKDENFLKDLI
jgi:hypothetical protein